MESVGKKCAWLERTVEELGAGERARRVRAGGGAGRGAVRRGDRAGARARCRCCASTRRRCCGRAGRWWRGRARSTRSEEADGLHAAEVLGLEREEVRAVEPYRGLGAPDFARLSQGRAHAGGLSAATGNGRKTPVDRVRHPPRPLISRASWAPFTRSRTRRAGWARPPPPSMWRPASPRPATRRCWSTRTRRATRPTGLGLAARRGPGALRGARRRRHRRRGGQAHEHRRTSRCSSRRPISPARRWSCRGCPARRAGCATR